MEQKKTPTEISDMDKPLPLSFMLLLPVYTGGILAVILFPFAGDWRWLEGWIVVTVFAVILTIGYIIINRENPRVLRNRMKTKKQGLTAATHKSAGSDRWVMPVMSIGFFGAMIWPALEHRWGWHGLPFGVELIAAALMGLGAALLMLAMYQNAHASKILDINQDQTLIDTGMYGKVRHPLYSGAILMILPLPIALGSLWGLIPALIGALTLVMRIKYEEEMLLKGMDGYADYQQRVKWKLIPGIY
jgi:protein-S-isoprenylcysteine O-methyltransferase Ste14